MANIHYQGYNIGLISSMPWLEYQKEPALKKFDEQLKGLKYRYLLAITADKFQDKSREILKNNGFRAVETFYSAHNNPKEMLTIWTKTRKEITKSPREKINFDIWNCSISFNQKDISQGNRCCLYYKNMRDKKDIVPPEFKRIKGTPIFYHIKDKDFME